MFKTIIASALLLSFSSAFAQQTAAINAATVANQAVAISQQNNASNNDKSKSTSSSPSTTEDKKVANVNYTPEQISKLELALSKGDYQDFFAKINSFKVSKENYIAYLLSKQYNGIVPLYWLMADHYANEKNMYETHKWFYISLIMTQQDSYLCTDQTARNAPRKLMEFFPESVHVTRATPEHIQSSMRDVNYFITNLKARIEPNWVCYYGDRVPANAKNLLIDRSNWRDNREKVFKNFVEKYQK